MGNQKITEKRGASNTEGQGKEKSRFNHPTRGFKTQANLKDEK